MHEVPPAPLLKAHGRVLPADSKSVRILSFEVPAGVEALAFRFDFRPRVSDRREVNAPLVDAAIARHNRGTWAAQPADALAAQRRSLGAENLCRTLNNLMNAVLIDPQGVWRGRWDRNPASEEEALLLSARAASNGFLAGPVQPGRWTVAVETHGVYGEPVTYDVAVEARPAPTDAEVEALRGAGTKGSRRARRSGRGWYFGELHSHTQHSDGVHELKELAARAHALGLDWLALTDHNTTSGLLEAVDLPLTLLPGCELTTFNGHHPIYGLTEIIPWHVEGRVLSLAELAPLIREKGGVVSVAHPFKVGDPLCTGCRMPEGLSPALFDLFEVWYRRWDAAESDNPAAYQLWNDYWRSGRRVTAVAARDWHGPSQEGPFPGPMAFTGIQAEDDSVAALLAGMKRGAVILSGGPIAELQLVAEGGRAGIGETLRAQRARVEVQLSRLQEVAELRLFRNGALVRAQRVEGDGAHHFDDVADGPGWYRAELWNGATPRAITNHVVLEPQR